MAAVVLCVEHLFSPWKGPTLCLYLHTTGSHGDTEQRQLHAFHLRGLQSKWLHVHGGHATKNIDDGIGGCQIEYSSSKEQVTGYISSLSQRSQNGTGGAYTNNSKDAGMAGNRQTHIESCEEL